MSIALQTFVWKAGPSASSQKFLLLALADHADEAGFCFPGLALLARKVSLDVRSVKRLMALLVRGEWVSVRRRSAGPRKRCSSYVLNVVKLAGQVALSEAPEAHLIRTSSAPHLQPILSPHRSSFRGGIVSPRRTRSRDTSASLGRPQRIAAKRVSGKPPRPKSESRRKSRGDISLPFDTEILTTPLKNEQVTPVLAGPHDNSRGDTHVLSPRALTELSLSSLTTTKAKALTPNHAAGAAEGPAHRSPRITPPLDPAICAGVKLVMDHGPFSGYKMARAIRTVLKDSAAKGWPLAEVAETMRKSWRTYLSTAVKWRVTPEKFFLEGLWLNTALWQLGA